MKRQRSLLLSTSALTFVTALGIFVPTQAQASCVMVSSDTTISNSSISCVTWTGGNITLTSSGSLSGTTGVSASNTAGSLTNNGVISSYIGINNTGSITTIINNNSIVTDHADISNSSGSIGEIENSGLISNGSRTAITNTGTIGTISNTGTINGGSGGISNNGSGTISTITNSGLIEGFYSGIGNATGGRIGLITNNVGATILGNNAGINNSGTISQITNSGLIEGPTAAIRSSGTILSALNNSGTIQGNIGVSQVLTITGGSSGALGTLTGYSTIAGTIAATGLVLDSNAYQMLAANVTVGSGSGTVTNNGFLRLNYLQSISGNYSQSTLGLLNIGVINSSSYGMLSITGAATLTNDTISLTALSGSLTAGEIFTIIQASSTGTDYSSITVSSIAGLSASITSSISGGFDDLIISLSSSAPTCLNVTSGATVNSSILCATWTGGNLSITNIGTISGKTTGVASSGSNPTGTLTNSGSISGTNYGVYNTGTIAAVVNSISSTISGATGLLNNSTITIITNSGKITGTVTGIYNTGSITDLTNSSGGTIQANPSSFAGIGIHNSGSIGTIQIAGTILAGLTGIVNQNTISSLNNTGLINATAVVLNNTGTIDAITNSGTMNATYPAIANTGSIGAFVNTGTITAMFSPAFYAGGHIHVLSNSGYIRGGTSAFNITGTIDTITNSGTIQGATNGIAIHNGATVGTISNNGLLEGGGSVIGSTGTILNAISNSGTIQGNINVNQDLTFTGGTVGTVGTLTGGSIVTNNHNLIFDSGANQLLAENVTVGASSTVSVAGILHVNAAQSITGNYTQSSLGLLNIGVTNSSSYGELVVSGEATLTGDTIALTALSGSLSAGETFTIMQAVSIGTDYSGITVSSISGLTASITSSIVGGFDDLIISLATISACQNVSSNTVISNSVACVTWTGANLSIASIGAISGAATAIVNVGHNVGTLTNSGSISDVTVAINNSGSINAINNMGTINSVNSAISNLGTIGTITNGGLLTSSHSTGVYNAGTIAALTNSGTITGTYFGIGNYGAGTIALIQNDSGGTISGGMDGMLNRSGSTIDSLANNTGGIISGDNAIFNSGTINTITTSAGSTISGATSFGGNGIYTNGYIGTINNSGVITGASAIGNDVSGDISTIVNNVGGTLSGISRAITNLGNIGNIINHGTIIGIATTGGIYNTGTIDTIINTGLISGHSALKSTGTILSALSNAGTIEGDISVHQALTLTGATAGTLGTLTGYNGTIATITTNNHDLTFDANAHQLLDQDINVGASNTVVNNGQIQINTLHTIAGNYMQSSLGLLNIGVTNSSSYGAFSISGAATLTDDTIALTALSGSLSAGETFTIVQASTIGTDYSGITVSSIAGLSASITSSIVGGFDDLIISLATIATGCQTVSASTIINGSLGCIAWTGGNISITNTGVVSGHSTAIINTGHADGTLTNNGSIIGAPSGIYNNGGTITTIINNGTISGTLFDAITNAGSIGAIVNNATITGGSLGIWNGRNASIGAITNNGLIGGGIYNGFGGFGTIGTISNASTGIISSTTFNGITNVVASTIAAIANSGTISGRTGIENQSGTIGAIINNTGGIITGATIGVSNEAGGSVSSTTYIGSIAAITNSGTISGGNTGINNAGSIGTIANSGTISGNSAGILSNGTIGTILNTGLMSGNTAIRILNNGTIGTLTNGGFISVSIVAIQNQAGATIGSVINNANSRILSSVSAIENFGSIGHITNNGTIIGSIEAVLNADTIGTLNNAGLIEGPNALASTGTILSALSNAGTIAGDINIDQALTITGGAVSGLGTLTGYNGTIATLTTNAHDLTFDANAFQLLDQEINVGALNTVFNNGLLQINTAHSITGNYSQSPAGTLVVGVTDTSHYGELVISGAATLTSSNIVIKSLGGALAAGETFTIVQAATAGTNYSGVVATANGFMVSTSSIAAGGFEDLIVDLTTAPSGGGGNNNDVIGNYARIGGLVGQNGTSAGKALDQIQSNIANGGNTNLAPVLAMLNTIGTQRGAATEGAAIRQLAPNQLSTSVAASNMTAMQSMQVVGQHQQNIRSSGSSGRAPTGRAAGSAYQAGALWMQVSGGFANSTTPGSAFHQSTYGLTFGADDKITKHTTLGLAVGWTHAGAQGSNELSGDGVSTSTPEIMGYGTYRMGKAYLDGMLGVGYNIFTQSRAIGFLNSVASSKFAGMQYMGNVETGYDFSASPRTVLTPLVGFQATRTDTDSYSESGAGAADTSVGRQIIDSYSTLLGGRVTTALPTRWGSLVPEARIGWMHNLNNSPVLSNATLGGVAFSTTSPRVSVNGAEVTLGATLERADALSLRAEYDGDLRSDYQSHTGELKGEWKF